MRPMAFRLVADGDSHWNDRLYCKYHAIYMVVLLSSEFLFPS